MKKPKKLTDKQKLRAYFTAAAEGSRTAPPLCRHFGDCGGCEFQDIPYETQLALKKGAFQFIADAVSGEFKERAADQPEGDGGVKAERLEKLLAGITPELVPSPKPYGYRQRMDYVFAFDKMGLRRVNRNRQVVQLEECPLLGEEVFGVVRRARDLAVEAGLASYDFMRHVGELRYFVVRRSRNGQVLLSLVTKTEAAEGQVLDVLRRLLDAGLITSGNWLLAPGLGDVSFGEIRAMVGAAAIVEEMNGLALRIGPNTFFQANPAVAEKAYQALRDFAAGCGRAFDLYSGVGCIAAHIASGPAAAAVTAVENVPENVALAKVNFQVNGLEKKVELRIDDSAVFLQRGADGEVKPGGDPADNTDPQLNASDAVPGLVVVNPPRPGVGDAGMARINLLAPKRIAYLSCNPFTLLRDLANLPNYSLRSLTLYDMFPQTRHFECLALLER